MNTKQSFKKFFSPLFPFFIVGLTIALFVGILFMFSYIILWGFIIGAVLWLITMLKQLLFPQKTKAHSMKKGRVIEHESKK